MQDLPQSAAEDILKASRLGILCLAEGGNAYGIPLYFGFDGERVYFHCHPGMKDEYLDKTKEACMTVIHVESEQVWESVQVFGRVERLVLTTDIEKAQSALFNVPPPPAPGSFPHGTPIRTEQDVYYARLSPSRVEGKASSYVHQAKAADSA